MTGCSDTSTIVGMALILVVDDLPDITHTTSVIMNALGHETREALSGHEAMKLAMNQEFDACLLDIGLPDISGLEVARFIRQMYGEKPKLLALTGHGGREMRVRCLDAGFDYHVLKPFDLRKINELLER